MITFSITFLKKESWEIKISRKVGSGDEFLKRCTSTILSGTSNIPALKDELNIIRTHPRHLPGRLNNQEGHGSNSQGANTYSSENPVHFLGSKRINVFPDNWVNSFLRHLQSICTMLCLQLRINPDRFYLSDALKILKYSLKVNF